MADRYWILGTGTWDATNTVNWSTSSGGSGGASVPTAADNVFFDVNSNVGTGAFTCTMANSPRVCNDFTASGLDGTMTLAGSAIGLTVSGSLTFQATNFTITYNGATTFNATSTGKTVTTNGVSLGSAVNFNGVGGGWTLGSAFSSGSATITLTNGTFDTSSSGNYAVTAGQLSSTNSNVRTINLNASTVNLSASSAWSILNITNLTFNAGTSTINLSNASATLAGGGLNYYNVAFTSTALSASASISGANTFNNLTITGRTTIGIAQLSLGANQTINGTFTVSAGTASAFRIMLRSSTIGITRTLTCAAVSLTDTDFRDITIAGAASPASGTRLGDCKGNTNITFLAAKTVYYGQTGSANWGATGSGSWSATSGGALDATQFPLAQDTAVFPAATYPASGSTITINANYNIGTIDMSLRTSNTMTLSTSNNDIVIYGSWTNGTGITLTSTATLFFAGRTTQQITSAGITFPHLTTIFSPGGSVTLQDALTILTLNLGAGTLDLQSYTLSTTTFNSSNSNTRTLAFGTGNITCTGTGTVWSTATVTGLTTTGTQVVNVTSTGSTAIGVFPGALSQANSISFNFTGGTYALTFLAQNNYSARNVDFTGYAGVFNAIGVGIIIYGNLKFSTGMTLTASANTMNFGATSGTQQITTNGKTLDFPLTFNGVGGTFQLQDALTMGSRTATLSNGTLDLQSFTLTTGLFSSNNSNARTLAFGTGKIDLTGTGTAWDALTATNFSTSGSKTVNFTNVGSTTITCNSGLSEADAVDFNVIGGTYQFRFGYTSGISSVRNLNFTGFSGTWQGLLGDAYIYGNLIMSATMLVGTSGSKFFAATSGTKTITSNGVSLNLVEFDGVGGTWQLQDAMDVTQATGTQFVNGTVDLNGNTLTTSIAKTEAGTKNITFNGGTLAITTASVIAFNNANPTNFTTTAGTGTGTISMTAATAKTFIGAGSTFNCTLNQGGAGTLTITGSNTFGNITNTVQPASVLFTAATTNTFTNFNLSGTSGNLITIGSVTSASHTLSKASGTVSVSFCSISRSNGTGGATWEAFTTNGNVDGGNNTGWSFGGVIYAAVIAEAATATDSILGLAAFSSALSETATATDSPLVAPSTFNAPVAETATATDSVLSQAAFNSVVAVSATATDSPSVAASTFNAPVAETATATDSPSVAASTFNAPVAETATATDAVLSFADFSSALSETSTATDSVISFADFYAALAETATATDSVISFADFYAALAETATAIDSPLVAPSTFNAPIAEIATATDAVSPPGSIYNVPVSETITISDLVLALFLWNLIDDSQSVTWQNINSSLGTTWSPIDTDPNTGWSVTPTVN